MLLTQLKKLTDRVERNRKEVEVTRGKYDSALSDLNAYNAKYMEDMTEVRVHFPALSHPSFVQCTLLLFENLLKFGFSLTATIFLCSRLT